MIYEFDPTIYPRKIWITYDATAEELNKKFPNSNCGKGFTDMDFNGVFYAVTYPVYESEHKVFGYLLRFPNKEGMSLFNIVHESVHVANRIFSVIGAEIDLENDETYAYLVHWIVKCCDSIKEKHMLTDI